MNEGLIKNINRLKRERGATILAHNYQVPEIQDLADFVGDSLDLSRKAAEVSQDLIVFCGVHFMAETASILCPDKKVLIPDLEAGCSLAATITADDLRKWKAEHPGAVVVSYVNTSAEVKAETDYCCTSANAVKIVQSIPKEKEILFLPDRFLGAYVAGMTGRKNIHIWSGECHVHADIKLDRVKKTLEKHADAGLLIHPESSCTSSCVQLFKQGDLPARGVHVLGTGGMIHHAKESKIGKFVVATETGIIHRLRKENPNKEFIPASEGAICQFMKIITLGKVWQSLKDLVYEVKVEREIADKARLALERMVAIG